MLFAPHTCLDPWLPGRAVIPHALSEEASRRWVLIVLRKLQVSCFPQVCRTCCGKNVFHLAPHETTLQPEQLFPRTQALCSALTPKLLC